METIIKKAIEGGWKDYFFEGDQITRINTDSVDSDGKFYVHFINGINNESYMLFFSVHQMLMEDKFWQSLGKACGWGKEHDDGCWYLNTRNQKCSCEREKEWLRLALRFHEINLTESWEKAVKYLEELIK